MDQEDPIEEKPLLDSLPLGKNISSLRFVQSVAEKVCITSALGTVGALFFSKYIPGPTLFFVALGTDVVASIYGNKIVDKGFNYTRALWDSVAREIPPATQQISDSPDYEKVRVRTQEYTNLMVSSKVSDIKTMGCFAIGGFGCMVNAPSFALMGLGMAVVFKTVHSVQSAKIFRETYGHLLMLAGKIKTGSPSIRRELSNRGISNSIGADTITIDGEPLSLGSQDTPECPSAPVV